MPQWLQDPDLLRKFEPSNPLVNDLQAAYIRNLISTYPKVGYTSRLAENPYTVEEYIDDIYSLVFGKTIAGKQLTLLTETWSMRSSTACSTISVCLKAL